mgnify:CR=1 FL=1
MLSNDDARAGRSAEPVQGLPRRQRARGMDAAAPRRLLCRERHRAAPQGRTSPRIDPRAREVVLADGGKVPYDRLLLATGAEPVRLPIPGADQPHVHTLRSLADSRAIIERAKAARRARRDRRELHRPRGRGRAARPRDRGPCRGAGEAADGAHPRARRWATSCALCTRSTASSSISRTRRAPSTASTVKLKSGGTLEADLVVVRRRRAPAPRAWPRRPGLPSIAASSVDAYLETSAPGSSRPATSRAGPIRTAAQRIRVEHWVVAERQGQAAALQHARPCARSSTRCRSSGASTTTSRSTMSATPRNGTSSRSRATSPARTACCASSAGTHARRRLDLPRRRQPAGRGGDGAGHGGLAAARARLAPTNLEERGWPTTEERQRQEQRQAPAAQPRLVRCSGRSDHGGALSRALHEFRPDAAPSCTAAGRSSASPRPAATSRPATAITSSWRAACATASATPAAFPSSFPVHPIQETGKRPTAALDRNLAYLSLVEVPLRLLLRRRAC